MGESSGGSRVTTETRDGSAGFMDDLCDAITPRTILLAAGVWVLQVAFVLSYVGAFHARYANSTTGQGYWQAESATVSRCAPRSPSARISPTWEPNSSRQWKAWHRTSTNGRSPRRASTTSFSLLRSPDCRPACWLRRSKRPASTGVLCGPAVPMSPANSRRSASPAPGAISTARASACFHSLAESRPEESGRSLLVVEGQEAVQRRATSATTGDPQVTAEGLNAIFEADEPGAFACVGSPDSVVADR
jgi:hypothetical protein